MTSHDAAVTEAAAKPPLQWPQRVVSALGTHALLIAGVGLFLFPFLWMLSTSFKTDEELPTGSVLPEAPVFQARSPYVKDVAEPEKPIDVPDDDWNQLLPDLVDRARRTIESAQAARVVVPLADTLEATALREAAARALVNSAAVKLNRSLWIGDRTTFNAAFDALLTEAAAKDALNNSIARLEFINVQLRTLNTQIEVLSRGSELAKVLRVESGPATVETTSNSALLRYDFGKTQDPVVVRFDFAFPDGIDFTNLHKLIVAIRADNSWHRVDATVDVGGVRWASQRTMPLAQHRTQSLIFQPPTFDDTTDRNKTWVPLRKTDHPPSAAESDQCSLRLIISPSSTLVANTEKATRNYDRAFYAVPFWRYVFNSVLLVALSTAGALFSSAFVAYAFARLHWPGRGVAFILLLSTMMLPSQVTMIPSFMIWRQLGWYNTLNPMWVPSWFGTAFFIFLMIQHMKTIPRELEEAARLDGLNALQSWYYIILPQVKPTLAAIAILSFMASWNEFMGPLIYLRDQSKFPLSLGLFGLRVDQTATLDWTMMMAGNVLMTLPVIVIFFLFQRYFIQGMTMSGMKG